MIIQLDPGIRPESQAAIVRQVQEAGYKPTEVRTRHAHYLVATGKSPLDPRQIGGLEGVRDIHMVTDPWQLVSAQWKVNPSVVDLSGVRIGGGGCALMAGPCSIESEAQVRAVLAHLSAQGVRIMRGGVFKPRSSPYSFRGLGTEGLKMWAELAREAGIRIISEVMQVSQIAEMAPWVDIFQVGARNTQNFNLLDALGEAGKPVLLKRGISGTVEELLYSAEYIFAGGNEQVLLCERGIRTYETAYRNTFDVNAIAWLKERSHLPVVADPSHGIGLRELVEPVALAAVLAGADGLIYEVHPVPEKAASDGQQTLDFAQSAELIRKVRALDALRQRDFGAETPA